MYRSTRYFIAHALLVAFVCFGASCGPQPGAGNNQNTTTSNINSETTKTLDRCDYVTIQNNILTMINNSHGSREQFINVMTGPGEFFLHGFTLDPTEHANIIQATEQLIRMDPNCRSAKIDTCHFYKTTPVEGHPMLRLPTNSCAAGYQACGGICIPATDTCFIKNPIGGGSNANANTMPSPTRTPSPSPSSTGGN